MSAGDAVLLDENGLIPASLLPNTGGETWERIAYNSTLVIGDVYRIRCPFGEITFVYNSTSNRWSTSTLYFPMSTKGSSTDSMYRSVSITSSNKIDKFEVQVSSSDHYSFNASDTNCRLYHLVE